MSCFLRVLYLFLTQRVCKLESVWQTKTDIQRLNVAGRGGLLEAILWIVSCPVIVYIVCLICDFYVFLDKHYVKTLGFLPKRISWLQFLIGGAVLEVFCTKSNINLLNFVVSLELLRQEILDKILTIWKWWLTAHSFDIVVQDFHSCERVTLFPFCLISLSKLKFIHIFNF